MGANCTHSYMCAVIIQSIAYIQLGVCMVLLELQVAQKQLMDNGNDACMNN